MPVTTSPFNRRSTVRQSRSPTMGTPAATSPQARVTRLRSRLAPASGDPCAGRGLMRRVTQLASLMSGAAMVLLLTEPAGAVASIADPNALPTRRVTYLGYQLDVPSSWPVVDLTGAATTCVRFDRHVVYLGHPGATQDCPSHLVGRTEAMLIEPLDGAVRDQAQLADLAAPDGQAAVRVLANPTRGEVRVVVAAAGVLVIAAYADDPALIAAALAGARLSPGARPAAPDLSGKDSLGDGTRGPLGITAVEPNTYTGKGFDACTAPSSSAMDAWLSSPYRAVGVYIGGINRACSQPNLTGTWVNTQTSKGWHLIPTYVGRQAPCSDIGALIDPANAATQGRAAADNAVIDAKAVNINPGSVLYFDMEAYDRPNTTCRNAVLTFLSNWTTRLHQLDYLSGVYSSASSGITDLVNNYNSTTFARPDHVWFARWDGVAETTDPVIPNTYWANHQRIKQYRGGHNETYSGITINIDNDYLDVAAGPPPPTQLKPLCLAVSGDWNNDLAETIGVGCQDGSEISWNLRNANSGGTPDISFGFGNYADCLTVPGDWDGNGTDTVGLACRPSGKDEIQWVLKNSNSSGVGDVTFGFGNAGSCWPMVGDWDGNGTDTIGVACHPSDGLEIQWMLKNSNSAGVPDVTFGYGNATTCRPVVGDWDGNATDTIGLACKESGTLELQWHLKNSNSSGVPDLTFGYGNATTCRPVVGDWDGNATDTIGLACKESGTLELQWHLKNSNSSGVPDLTFGYGNSSEVSLTSGWAGPGWPL